MSLVMRQVQFINSLQQIARSESVGVFEGISRHFGWQARRLLRWFPCELTISQSRLFVAHPNGVTALVNCMGMYDFNNMSLVKMLLSDGPATFIDVGANIGAYTLIASEVPSASVLSIEPHPDTFAMLQRNVEGNHRINVTCLRCAISDHEGELSLTDYEGSPVNRVIDHGQNGERDIQILCRTLDDTCTDFGFQPHVVKVDVEGHEGMVLAGFRHFLPRTKLLLIEGGERGDIAGILNAAGFLGPIYFHFVKRVFAPFPQRRAEDPIYINKRHLDDFRGMEICADAQKARRVQGRHPLK